MYTIEYVRRPGTKHVYMKMTARQFSAFMKYSAQPGGGKIFGDAWLVAIHRDEYGRDE